MCRISLWVAGVADNVHIAAGNGGNHRRGVGLFILRCKNRLVETGEDKIQRRQHRPGAVDLTVGIFDIRLDAAQYPNAVHQTWPDPHIHKMPVVRRIRHVRTMIGDREQLNAFQLRLGDIIMEVAIRVGTGDGVHMQVNGIHLSLLCGFSKG